MVGPGALKPSVGEGKVSSRLLVQSLICILSICMCDIYVAWYVYVSHFILQTYNICMCDIYVCLHGMYVYVSHSFTCIQTYAKL